MTMTSSPVWIWLPQRSEPLQCGTYSLNEGVGRFTYSTDYIKLDHSLALDPRHLPISRSERPSTTKLQYGVFGVLRDGALEGFALDLAEHLIGQELGDPHDRLRLSPPDAVGAITVGRDVESKSRVLPPEWDTVAKTLSQSDVAGVAAVARSGTGLGGERPKLTVLDGERCSIAKLAAVDDAPYSLVREFAAMRLAKELGLDVADVELRRCDSGLQVLLVSRFDRHVRPDRRIERRLFASAHSVLGLDFQTRGDPLRSYVRLAAALGGWVGAEEVGRVRRELWRRMAFNAVVGNGDDHPRNHGLVHTGRSWTLSPAYDIAPHGAAEFRGVLSMAVARSGSSIATRENLLSSVDAFDMPRTHAQAFLDQACVRYVERWPALVEACGVDPVDVPTVDPATWLEKEIA